MKLMPNRYATLVGSNKISAEYTKITAGFDGVQADMDGKAPASVVTDLASHTGNATIHVTAGDKTSWSSKAPGNTRTDLDNHIGSRGAAHGNATQTEAGFMPPADKTKLNQIEAGAEKNKPAFAHVNDISADNPDDTLTIEGDVGIVVTTNPATKMLKLTVTGESTPGAHGTSHTEFGSDPIPNATETEGGLMSAADKAELNGLSGGIADLAGAGRTTETVKGNADAIADVAADVVDLGSELAAQKAETVTGIFNVVEGYGADPSGTLDSYPAFAAAITAMDGKAGLLWVPSGSYKLSAPINLNITGMRLVGESWQNTYLITTNPSGIDLVRISASHVEITGIHFRPTYATDVCIRVYAGLAYIHNNRFLSAASNQGKAIILTDTDPVDSSFKAGAYTHTIYQNYFGAAGYAFEYAIDTSGTSGGQNATVILRNQFLGNNCIRIHAGGGNNIAFNLMQSSTGTYGSPAGIAIDCIANIGDIASNNYFERYQYTTYLRAGASKISEVNNHYDNNANKITSASSAAYNLIDIDNGVVRYRTGYVETYQDVSIYQQIIVTADGSAITPGSSFVQVLGNSAHRTNCSLHTSGAKAGQRLTLYGLSWSVQIVAGTTAKFASGATDVTFGNGSGNIMMMELIFEPTLNRWVEVNRSTV